MPDEASVAPACPWRYFRRWVRQVGEDLGIIAPPAAPSFHFGATLDVAIIFAATCDLAKVLNAVLNAPLIFGATLG